MKIAIIIPYFGKLPNYFPLFLKSAEFNRNIDFIFYTDQEIKSESPNIIVKNVTFLDLKSKIESLFDFEISLEGPYKLCDYRPAFGEIFSSDLLNYDFWGHCDVDMILGDIKTYVNDNILDEYDKVFEYGHLCLYRNDSKINSLYRDRKKVDYQKIFQNKGSWCFDEKYGIQKIFDYYEVKTYKKNEMLDISPKHFCLQRVLHPGIMNHKFQIFTYENGHVYMIYLDDLKKKVIKQEYMYIHLQKRPMEVKTDNNKCYVITPNSFVKKDFLEVDRDAFLKNNKKSILKEIQFLFKNQKYQFNRRIHKYLNF